MTSCGAPMISPRLGKQVKTDLSLEISRMSDQAVSSSAVMLAFGTGLAVGVVFSLVKLPSPAPPLLGLIGLVGMFTGQRLWPFLVSRLFH
jgi:XapX domain-containing protein